MQRSTLPPCGPERVAALDELEDVIVTDVLRQIDVMAGRGWHPLDAADAVRNWWPDLVRSAVDRAVAEWAWAWSP